MPKVSYISVIKFALMALNCLLNSNQIPFPLMRILPWTNRESLSCKNSQTYLSKISIFDFKVEYQDSLTADTTHHYKMQAYRVPQPARRPKQDTSSLQPSSTNALYEVL